LAQSLGSVTTMPLEVPTGTPAPLPAALNRARAPASTLRLSIQCSLSERAISTVVKRMAPYRTLNTQWRGYVGYICGILIRNIGFARDVGRYLPLETPHPYRLIFFIDFIVRGVEAS